MNGGNQMPRVSGLRYITLFFVSFLFVLIDARAQSRQEVGTADGRMTSGRVLKNYTFEPIEGARLTLMSRNESVYTDTAGTYRIPGSWVSGEVRISGHGFVPYTAELQDGGFRRGSSTFSLVRDTEDVPALVIGDTVPESFWDLPLPVVNHPGGRSRVTFREYMAGRPILVLDFWATWCAPCIKSFDRWNGLAPGLADSVAVIGVHVSRQDKVPDFIRARQWPLPTVVGDIHPLVNAYFFHRQQVGNVVIIRNGIFYAVPKNKGLDTAQLRALISGAAVDMEMEGAALHGKGEVL
ncbi:TlpA family protein disulfide reductase [Sphingobacterium sp. SGG-5]|uniref:TlpA family protein disulfide reductase n=1 Tax=Sphingobacterium sp. SGG-5 TaxID=2710881 RepID=UPI0013ED0F72|nr:TlpA disulfide reductase family protein [Sphingobacterium sp. SGG-5]NGM60469.1 TlpA family protein disulfide reductase [Sphingobacterium sp. SGG-5]